MKAKDIRKGNVILFQNAPYKVLDFFHNTPGKGKAVVQAKLRNLLTGNQTETRFGSTDDVEEADIFVFKAQYLYNDAEGFHFMNVDNYEQISLSKELIEEQIPYLQPEMQVQVTLYNESPIGITLPSTVILTVVETEPELKGATAANSPKPAKTDTGLVLSVPPFIKIGEKIVVNTEEGTYVGRPS
ncbi:MAG: elongation factor P [SAR324 cluster bacterium]|uniref:Elongation factor P n=1 Tax=SAR324 cluster bacterium TaxID=2024889 RepID=A0A7X9FS93_9DELT|nr:elongation factor P [SAR324 cluster bacterium]